MIQKMSKVREYRYEWDVLHLKCTKCGEWKTKDLFHKKSWRQFWIRAECKECEKKYSQENKDRISERLKNWRNDNKDKIRDYKDMYRRYNKDKMSKYRDEYYKQNREHILENTRDYKQNRTKELWFNLPSFHNKARWYVISHRLKPKECPICWEVEQIEIHHPYYDSFEDWSNVVFCCRSCHHKIHAWTIECPKPINLLD
jgi:hypothetical protein